MSRKSRHQKSKVYVKYVKDLTQEEWEKSPLFESIRQAVGNRGNADGFRLNVALDNGDMVQKKFREIKWGKDSFKDMWSEEYTLVAVKVGFSDGTSDYGFKFRESKTIVNRKNAVLEPIFIREGIWSERDGEFVDCPKSVISTRKLPAWMLKRLPMYNERRRDIAKSEAKECRYRRPDEETFEGALHSVMISDLTSNWAAFGKPPFEGFKDNGKFAYKISSAFNPEDRVGRWNVGDQYQYEYVSYSNQFTEYNPVASYYNPVARSPLGYYIVTETNKDAEEEIESETDPIRKRLFEEMSKRVVFRYSYLKSIYQDNVSTRKVYGLFPMGSVLNIERVNYWHDKNGEEVWNNLDQTVAGNL